MADGDAVFDDLNRLQAIIEDLDERGLVLALAAFAEDALGDLLSAFMQPGEAATALLCGFNAPLGNLSSRIKAAFALGLITSHQHQNLDRLRRIRNEYAHAWEPLSFDDQRIASHILALHYSPMVDRFPNTKIEKVRSVIGALLIEIRSVTHQVDQNGWRTRTVGTHLIPGLPIGSADSVGTCEAHLSAIGEELPNALGERRSFLLAQRDRWISLLTLRLRAASSSEKLSIAKVLALYDPTFLSSAVGLGGLD